MTACSTIAGMIPIAIGIGAGAETRGPMGACVVGGLVTSTLLTLVVIPVMYSLVDDGGQWVLRVVKRLSGEEAPQGESAMKPSSAEIPATEVSAAGDVTVDPEPEAIDVSEAPPNAR
jgi:HAE1 family hydrophobic/amphiphilic exporter-1